MPNLTCPQGSFPLGTGLPDRQPLWALGSRRWCQSQRVTQGVLAGTVLGAGGPWLGVGMFAVASSSARRVRKTHQAVL